MRRAIVLVLLVAALEPSAARAQCRASARGSFSYEIRLSPRAGRACLHIVHVHAPRCEAARRVLSVELGCSETRRMTITDRGRLVSVLAPRASRPEWEIVRVTWREGDRVVRGSVPLRALAPHRSARVELDGDAVRVLGPGEPVRVALEDVERIAAANPLPRAGVTGTR